MHLQGSKVVSVKESLDHQSSHPKASSMKVQTFADDLIDGYETSIQMSLRHDEQFMQGILTHLEPALIRMENSLPIYNPLLEPLKKQYGKLLNKVRVQLNVLKKNIIYPFQMKKLALSPCMSEPAWNGMA